MLETKTDPGSIPKKPVKMTIYTAFSKIKFPEFKQQDPSMDFKAISKMVAEEYKKLTEDQKEFYQNIADDHNEKKMQIFEDEQIKAEKSLSQPTKKINLT